ncbi:MAG: YXWGXW repeat-containing protein [Pseudomonadota bacterium]
MWTRKSLVGIFIISTLTTLPAMARSYIEIETAPPPVRQEIIPGHKRGYIWAPGYWNWRGNRHVWMAGHWVKERPGRRWIPEHWEQHGRRYHFSPGHWEVVTRDDFHHDHRRR